MESVKKQEGAGDYVPRVIKELVNLCSQSEAECGMSPRLRALSLESLLKVLENGLERVDALVAVLGNADAGLRREKGVSGAVKGGGGREAFLERVIFEEEYEKMRARVKEKKRENRVLREKIMIINLRAKELGREKVRLQKAVDRKTYEKYEILKTIKKDYEQTKLENIRYLDRIDELERQKEVVQDGYHMFSEENERLRRQIRKLYSEKLAWFGERDRILSKLESLDVGRLRSAVRVLERAQSPGRLAALEAACRKAQAAMLSVRRRAQGRGGGDLAALRRLREKTNQENESSGNRKSEKGTPRAGEAEADARLKALSADSVVRGLSLKNEALRRENQKYFEFVLELKGSLELENSGVADRLMVLVEKNVDGLFLAQKARALRERSELLAAQNERFAGDFARRLGGLDSEMESLRRVKRALLLRVEVVFRENLSLAKTNLELCCANSSLARELAQSSRLLATLAGGARNEVARARQILSTEFWANLGGAWDGDRSTDAPQKGIFPKEQSRETQEYLLGLLEQSSAEADEERLSRAKDALEGVARFLEAPSGEADPGAGLEGEWEWGRLRAQLSRNAEGLCGALWTLWRKAAAEAKAAKRRLACEARPRETLGKRGARAN